MESNLFTVLFGLHAYGLTPEEETGWCRFCLIVGVVIGLCAGSLGS